MLSGLVCRSESVLEIEEHVPDVVAFVRIGQVVLVYRGLDFGPKLGKCLCLLLVDLPVILVFVIEAS